MSATTGASGRGSRYLLLAMSVPLAMALMPAILVWAHTGQVVGLTRSLVLLLLLGALLRRGYDWARWGVVLWFLWYAFSFFLAAMERTAAVYSEPVLPTVMLVAISLLYVLLAVVLALSSSVDALIERAREENSVNRAPA